MGRFKEILRDVLYPGGIKCIVCDAELGADNRYGLCETCRLPYNETYCSICGRQVPAQNIVCDECKDETYAFTAARASFIYCDAAATLVHKLKYRDARYLAPVMAEFMVDTFYETDWQVDAVTFVPLHIKRRRERGYNQSELLAQEVAARIGRECKPLLKKTVHTSHMVGLNKAQRKERIHGSFVLAEEANCTDKSVLLIDDVLTTGATANECARVLKEAKCGVVYVLTFASVPSGVFLAESNKTFQKRLKRPKTRKKQIVCVT